MAGLRFSVRELFWFLFRICLPVSKKIVIVIRRNLLHSVELGYNERAAHYIRVGHIVSAMGKADTFGRRSSRQLDLLSRVETRS